MELGLGLSMLQGLGNNTADYDGLRASLEERGFPCAVAQVARADWLRNAAGLLDANYWKGTLKPRPVLDWYALHPPCSLSKRAASQCSWGASGLQLLERRTQDQAYPLTHSQSLPVLKGSRRLSVRACIQSLLKCRVRS